MKLKLALCASLLLVSCSGDDEDTEEPVNTTDNMNASGSSMGGSHSQTDGMNNSMQGAAASAPAAVPTQVADPTPMSGIAAAAADAVEEENQTESAPSMWVSAWVLNVRKGPGMSHGVVRHIKKGDQVSILETRGSWGRIGDDEWASTRFMKDTP